MQLHDQAPDFSLKGVDNKIYSLASFSATKALIVVFSCNHCPYVVAYEERLVQIQADYKAQGVALVAINSNDALAYPEDSFTEMIKRARQRKFNFPYLYDESQNIARAYGATNTPHLFVFDAARRLAYTGKIDDNWENPSAVTKRYLRDALDDLVAGHTPRVAQTHAIGCTIKWRPT